MATRRKSATRRPKARKAAASGRARKKPAARARPARKAAPRPQPARKAAARGAAGAKGKAKDARSAPKPKVKTLQRPAPTVQPLGVLPPEAMARASHKPARAVPTPPRAPARAPSPSLPETESRPVTSGDYQDFERILLAERARVLKEMGHYETTVLKVNQRDSAGDLSGYSFHMADVGTDAMEREKAFQLASAEGRLLLEINEALRRIARGEYGVCESCGNPILRERLLALPTARLCIPCKEKEERAARGLA